jgi:prepilin-type N-terminal cleavage/methylation domain-containing protein
MRPRFGGPNGGFSLLEILVSLALFAILVVAIHQSLSLTFAAAESSAARFRCLVTAQNILEQAHSQPGPLTPELLKIISGGATGQIDRWYGVPAAFSSGGLVNLPEALLKTATIRLKTDTTALSEVATDVAVIVVRETLHRSEVSLQVFRSPLE